jgi:DNA-directed RNA polymerase subunit K/omega
MKNLNITIPMRPLLRSFIRWQEGAPAHGPVILEPRGVIRALLRCNLCGKRDYLTDPLTSAPTGPVPALIVSLSGSGLSSGHMFLSAAGAARFEVAVYELHRALFLRHILTATAAGVSEAAAIRDWMVMLKIEETESWQDSRFQTLKKISTRGRLCKSACKTAIDTKFRRGMKPAPPAIRAGAQLCLF